MYSQRRDYRSDLKLENNNDITKKDSSAILVYILLNPFVIPLLPLPLFPARLPS
jgi:hypothetical protein